MPLIFVFVLLLLWQPLAAQPAPRVVLGIYNSDHDTGYKQDDNPIHHNAEMVLNWLGLFVRYHDIADGVPSDKEMEGVVGILSWFEQGQMRDPLEYIDWAVEQINRGKKFVIVEDPGCTQDYAGRYLPSDEINRLFNRLGLEYQDGWSDNPFQISIASFDSKMMDFERKLSTVDIPEATKISSEEQGNQVYLTLKCAKWPDVPVAAVVSTPTGGFAATGCSLFIDQLTYQKQWLLNPFAFFDIVFHQEDQPRFDTATLLGRRIFFSHVDGDGVRNMSQIRGYREAGEVILKEVFQQYWMPVTASFITCEIDPHYFGYEHVIDVAKEIFALPHIQCGVHGFSHPLNWKRKLVSFALPHYSHTIDPNDYPQDFDHTPYETGAIVDVDTKTYLRTETVDAADYLNQHICPKDKQIVMNLWTGNCEPQGDALRLIQEAGLKDINRGDSRFDRSYPSYTNLAPLVRQVGDKIQVHAVNSNEDIYTNNWEGPFYALRYVIETFQQTEIPTLADSVPRRVAPMNLYYHYYSGEKLASLGAVKTVLDYVLGKPIIALYAQEYCSMVHGFISGTIEALGEDGWRFAQYGACQTVRFDREKGYPDLDRSKGIIGFARWNHYLYVALDEAGEAELYFTERPPTKPYLEEASSIIRQVAVASDQISFHSPNCFPSTYIFANLPPHATYLLTIADGVERENSLFTVGEDGRLSVTVRCESPALVRLARQ